MADRMDALLANGADEIKARRYRSTLFNIGTGIVAFCAWSVVRMAAFIVGSMSSFRESALEAARESGGEDNKSEAALAKVEAFGKSL